MDIQDLIGLFRSQVADEEDPFLWSDPEVLQYLIEAQDTLVRRMGGISKMTVTEASDPDDEELHDLELEEDEPYSDISPYVLRIRSARLLSTNNTIKIISEAEFSQIQTCDYGQVASINLDDEDTGPVTHAIIGLVDDKLRWYRVPADDDTVRLHVYRLPYPRIADQEDSLEVKEQHHIALLDWVKYRAYNKQDSEVFDKEAAAGYKESFEDYCKTAFSEQDRLRFKPRMVQFGGIR